MRVLFVCTVNRLRSPTAESLFSTWPGVEALSAGTDSSATTPLTAELVASADLIFAMEKHHRDRIRKRFKARPSDERIITLNRRRGLPSGNMRSISALHDAFTQAGIEFLESPDEAPGVRLRTK